MPYELVSKRVLYEGEKIALELHTLDDGNGRQVVKEVARHPGAVCVLPFLDADTILLIKNHRQAVGKTLLELPAGTLGKGEDPMNCAGRELQEETGHLADRLARVGSFYTAPGILSELIHAFAAYDLVPTRQQLEAGEEIEVVPTRYSDAFNLIRDGELVDAKSICALLMFDRFGTRG